MFQFDGFCFCGTILNNGGFAMKKFWAGTLFLGLIAYCLISPAYAFRLAISRTTYPYGYGYGKNNWDNMTSAINNAIGASNVVLLDDLTGSLSGYDALMVELRNPSDVLSTTEMSNLQAFITTGKRVVMFGENDIWYVWNNSILGVVGGSFDMYDSGVIDKRYDHFLTTDVSSVYLPVGGIAVGGTSLFDGNFATLWEPGLNVLTVLDVNVVSDVYWNYYDNSQFATNIANWLARSPSSPNNNVVPEPTSVLLFGFGLLAIGVRRKR